MTEGRKDQDALLLIAGAALITVGGWLLMRQLGLVPAPILHAWSLVRDAKGAVALVLIGVAVLVFAARGVKLRLPAKGQRLYKSRSDKWASGVLAGVARYLGLDPVLVRLVFLGLVFMGNFGTALIAYIILSVVMPEEPASPQAG